MMLFSASSSFSRQSSSSSLFSLQRRYRPRSMRHPNTRLSATVANCRKMEKWSYIVYGRHTRLRDTHPNIAAEWDYSKNPSHLHPAIVVNTTLQPMWWVCAECAHSYRAPVERRTLFGAGCPECAKQNTTSLLEKHEEQVKVDGAVVPGSGLATTSLHGVADLMDGERNLAFAPDHKPMRPPGGSNKSVFPE